MFVKKSVQLKTMSFPNMRKRSKEHTDAALARAREWITSLQESVETGSAWNPQGLRIDKDSYVDDSRQHKMAEAALERLPKPLQTLLQTLLALKIDIAREEIRVAQNFENAQEAEVETVVGYASSALQTAAKELTLIRQNALEDLQILRPDVEAFLGPSVGGPETWATRIHAELVRVQQRAHEQLLRASERRPTVIAPDTNSSSVASVKSTVQASAAFRARMKDLSTGTLSNFADRNLQARLYSAHERPPMQEGGHVKPPAEKPSVELDDAEQVSRARSLLRQLRRFMASVMADRKMDIDDVCMVLAGGLRNARVQVSGPPMWPFELPEDLADADDALQKEIGALLQTFSIDKSSFDQYLRAIRSHVGSLHAAAAQESATRWNVSAARWSLQLIRAFEMYTQALEGQN